MWSAPAALFFFKFLIAASISSTVTHIFICATCIIQSQLIVLMNLSLLICRVNKYVGIMLPECICYVICFLIATNANVISIYMLAILGILTFPKIVYIFMSKIFSNFIYVTCIKIHFSLSNIAILYSVLIRIRASFIYPLRGFPTAFHTLCMSIDCCFK